MDLSSPTAEEYVNVPLFLLLPLFLFCDNLVGSEAPPVGCHTVLNDRFFLLSILELQAS